MDVKQDTRLRSILFTSIILICCIACQKKKEVPDVVDDNNGKFAGKSCYGKAVQNQFLLKWTDGSYSLFNGDKSSLESLIKTQYQQKEEVLKKIVLAEQNRFIDKDSLFNELKPSVTNFSIGPMESNFWQVWGQEDMQVSDLWDKNFKGQNVAVAVIDDGIDINHPSLLNRMAINEKEIPGNNIDDDENGYIDDTIGYDFFSNKSEIIPSKHGTHVAGIVVAEPQNSPMIGVAPESKIIPIDVMGPKGGTLDDAVKGILYAQMRGAKIINASWGGNFCAEILKEVIEDLAEKNILFINAAGNNGDDIEVWPEFPAAFNLINQITVGASMPSGLMATFSNYGYNQVHILAPGHLILSTIPEGWTISSGTSMATPFVSGLAALLWGAYPEASMMQIKNAIIQSVVDPKDYNPVVGKGRVNAALALEKLEMSLK